MHGLPVAGSDALGKKLSLWGAAMGEGEWLNGATSRAQDIDVGLEPDEYRFVLTVRWRSRFMAREASAHHERPMRVIVVGGSIAGLCAGIALRGNGHDVQIYERAAGQMVSRGAGIVVQDDFLRLLDRHNVPAPPTVPCLRRRYLVPDGGERIVIGYPQRFTSWYAIYQTLRSAFPEKRYHLGSTVKAFEPGARGVVVQFAERAESEADLLVCADGSFSEMRRRLLPEVRPRYAGYVAWRGILDEEAAPPELVRFFDGSLTLSGARSGGHILSYFIPGHGAATERGRRQLNWLWYVTVPDGQDLARLLTDKTGVPHEGSLGPGSVSADVISELHAAARRELHPRFSELVNETPDPFIQVIRDVIVPRMAFGRVCLLGDAAFVVRPHLAAATAKAASDAAALGAVIGAYPNNLDHALGAWETRQLEYGRDLVNQGIALGTRSVKREKGEKLLWADLHHTIQSLEGIARPRQASALH
jgi:2-polyprenyl-6-methoxyphenol hydroxylase-like FAD-dependent oxidoreductase